MTTTTLLTAHQAEVLSSIRNAGSVTLKHQTGRVKRTITRLADRGLLNVTDGIVTAPQARTSGHVGYPEVLAAATVELGHGWRRAVVELADGQTLWCPTSTKKHFTGAGTWTFLFHPSSIEVESAPARWDYIYRIA